MSIRALAFDLDAVSLLETSWDPPDEWFQTFLITDPSHRVFSRVISNVAVLASDGASADRRLLIVDLGETNFFKRFTGDQSREVFRRIRRVALAAQNRNVTVPYSWRPYNQGSKISFHVLPLTAIRTKADSGRIEIDRNPFGTPHVFAYNCSEGWSDLQLSKPSLTTFTSAVRAYDEFIAQPDWRQTLPATAQDPGAIELSEGSFFYAEERAGLREWYELRLTAQQRNFVDTPREQAIRLRGAAGTGKTLALVIRFLTVARERLLLGIPTRAIFLCHSTSALAAATELINHLDNESILDRLRALEGSAIVITTLLDQAMSVIGKDLTDDGVMPLAADASEARRMQLELIESELKAYRQSIDWKANRAVCSESFRKLIEQAGQEIPLRRVAWEIMNEFACVLEADGVKGIEEVKRYMKAQRMAWMLQLPNEADRNVIIQLYRAFQKQMVEFQAISVDQVITDYLSYLDSFRWNASREKRGFDLIFVDELHIFNRQERMVLHGLSSRVPPMLSVAYDAKQAPIDTFMPMEESSNKTIWKHLQIPSNAQIELDRVFRYSPQIAKFIGELDRSFTALDLGEDWGRYSLTSAIGDSSVPSLTILADESATYQLVLTRARELKRAVGEKLTVAVLCCNADQFTTYRDAGALQKSFISISSRDDASWVKSTAYKFVLSTPEYVAGLQFDIVLLADVNAGDVPEGAYAAGAQRRHISTVYLGASRARRHLEVFASNAAGGPSKVLDGPRSTESIKLVQFEDLPSAAFLAKELKEPQIATTTLQAG